MMNPPVEPYGAWKSPITPIQIAVGSRGLSQLKVVRNRAFWVESRPSEGGRSSIVSCSLDGSAPCDELPPLMSARNRVNEYGSGSYCVGANALWFTNADDQRIHRVDHDGTCLPITTTPHEDHRYSDLQLSRDEQWIICQRERHPTATGAETGTETINELIIVAANGSSPPRIIASGRDFYGAQRIRPDGGALVWIEWDHPHMPWDGCELFVADLNAEGQVDGARRVAGGSSTSIFQPSWSANGVLHFVSDHGGWWNLYALREGETKNLCPMEAEFGAAYWAFWFSMHTHLSNCRIASIYIEAGRERLGLLLPDRNAIEPLDLPFTFFGQGGELQSASDDRLVFLAGSPMRPTGVYSFELQSKVLREIYRPAGERIDERYLSQPRAISFPTTSIASTIGNVDSAGEATGGASSNSSRAHPERETPESTHAFYYPPKNDDYAAPDSEKPPLVVLCHGGPTGATDTALNLKAQFWTSRGFAVVDVNYRGSTGYGRAYREAINGRSGLVEPRDCEAAARYLAAEGLVDETRMAIRGGSAGGYVVLCCAVFPEGTSDNTTAADSSSRRSCFSAGTSLYGIADLEALVRETHKFESHYPFTLIAPYPEGSRVYRDRSPLHFVSRQLFLCS